MRKVLFQLRRGGLVRQLPDKHGGLVYPIALASSFSLRRFALRLAAGFRRRFLPGTPAPVFEELPSVDGPAPGPPSSSDTNMGPASGAGEPADAMSRSLNPHCKSTPPPGQTAESHTMPQLGLYTIARIRRRTVFIGSATRTRKPPHLLGGPPLEIDGASSPMKIHPLRCRCIHV